MIQVVLAQPRGFCASRERALVRIVGNPADFDETDPERLAHVTQWFPSVMGRGVRGICYATQNREQSVQDLAKLFNLILVVGSTNGSNFNRLHEIGCELGKPSYLIQDAAGLVASWFDGVGRAGLTAGASAPETLVQGVITGFRQFGEISVPALAGVAEDVKSKFPAELQ